MWIWLLQYLCEKRDFGEDYIHFQLLLCSCERCKSQNELRSFRDMDKMNLFTLSHHPLCVRLKIDSPLTIYKLDRTQTWDSHHNFQILKSPTDINDLHKSSACRACEARVIGTVLGLDSDWALGWSSHATGRQSICREAKPMQNTFDMLSQGNAWINHKWTNVGCSHLSSELLQHFIFYSLTVWFI